MRERGGSPARAVNPVGAAGTVSVASPGPTASLISPLGATQFTPLLENGDFSQGLASTWTVGRGNTTIVQEAGPYGTPQYMRHQFVPEGSHPWSVQMSQRIKKPLKAGDHVEFRGWLRSPESVVLYFYIETAEPPHDKIVSDRLNLTPEWKEYTVVRTIKKDCDADTMILNIHFGVIPGAVAMANFRLNNYGPATPVSGAATL
jgi:hypothetical protein